MKPIQFWLIVVVIALVTTWAYLVINMDQEQARYNRIENHSEITGIDTSE